MKHPLVMIHMPVLFVQLFFFLALFRSAQDLMIDPPGWKVEESFNCGYSQLKMDMPAPGHSWRKPWTALHRSSPFLSSYSHLFLFSPVLPVRKNFVL